MLNEDVTGIDSFNVKKYENIYGNDMEGLVTDMSDLT